MTGEVHDDLWDLIVDTNLSAVLRTARAAMPHLRENGGTITVTASSARDHHLKAFCGDDPSKTIEDMKSPAASLNLLPVPWIEPEAARIAL